MKLLSAFLAVLLLAMVGGLGYQFLYPPQVMKRATRDALESFSMAVETQDPVKVKAALESWLADDAKIRLEVEFFMLMHTESNKLITQDFDKPSFIGFIDNLLFTVTDYHYIPKLETFSLDNKNVATVQFSSTELAKGPSYYAGSMVMMRYSTTTTCKGEVIFPKDAPRLLQAHCLVRLRMTPTSEGNVNLQTPQMLRDMMKEVQKP